MNLEDFQAQFDEIFRRNKLSYEYFGEETYFYSIHDNDIEELYNLCLKALGEL